MTEDDPVLIGIDAGLTNVTVTAFDGTGDDLATASEPTPTVETPTDRDEQDHDRLWETVGETVTAVLDAPAVTPAAVAGVGVAGHGHGLYGLDSDGEPVCGIKSTDSRAIGVIDEQRSDVADAVIDRLGWQPFGADPLSLLVWLAEHDPATYDRLDTVLFAKDVLTHRLTGERSTDPTEGSVFYGPEGEYDREIFELLDVPEAFETLPPVKPSTGSCGTVTSEAAARTGLPEGTPVATGFHDVAACALGAGLTAPGDGLAILGTWGQSVAVLDSPADGTGGLPRRYLDGWIRYKGLRAGAACVEWFTETYGADWHREARERDIDPHTVYEETIADVDPGSNGVVFHPFLNGSTDDPTGTGGFFGLRMDHTDAQMLRSIYEGVAVAQTNALSELAPELESIRLTGGGARSDEWARMFADIAGRPVTVPAERETGALGAALCGGVAAGVYPDVERAVERTVEPARRYEPNPDVEATYRTLATAFSQAVDGMRAPWETLKSLREMSQHEE